VGVALADELRSRGDRVRIVHHDSVDPDFNSLLADDDGVHGIVDCWPLDITDSCSAAEQHRLGVLTVLRLIKSLAAQDNPTKAQLYLVTGNSQPAPGTDLSGVDQAAVWGLGRVIGHQEFPEHWGGLIDIDANDNRTQTATRICEHLFGGQAEDQIAIRGQVTFVPRLRACGPLTRPFPTKLSGDATYVVTGGAGALGRVVATYLAERGARHITLLSRSAVPTRDRWTSLTEDDAHYATVKTIGDIERLGVQITTVSVDVADAEQVTVWLSEHTRSGGRPVRGIVHAAGSVNDQLLVNASEADFAAVMAPKVTGTRVLHEAFKGCDLEFFVMFGSAGSTIASPGQGNYAAANAFLDAFAHYRRAQGLPALTIGWGPWSVGMVEELNLEKLYAKRGIELITPAVGALILDRLLNQQPPNVVAISADWGRARQAGLGGRLPLMFSELGTSETVAMDGDADGSVLMTLAATAEADRHAFIAGHLSQIVATVFDCGIDDFEPDDQLDDIGLDSMMAMEFRVRINTTFSIDLPVLEILRGVSVNSLADRVLDELHTIHGEVAPLSPEAAAYESDDVNEELDRLMGDMSDAELQELLAQLEAESGSGAGEALS